MIKERNIFMVYLLSLITFGFYGIYWLVVTKEEMNSLGAEIPTAFLIIIPFANIYWVYKYCEAFSNVVKKDDSAMLWFVVYLFVGFVMPYIVQSELNKLATS